MRRYNSVGLPWGGKLGTNVTDCETLDEVLDKANLNWFVKKCELVARMPFNLNSNNEVNTNAGDFVHDGEIYRDCPNGYATYRTDKNIPLGIVKSKYEVIQNIDAFEFIDNAIGEGKALYQSAGCFGYGHKVFITAKLPITTTVGDDKVNNYLIFSTTHDGSGSVDILFTPVRMICLNMLNAAFNEASSHIRIRHTKSAQDQLNFGSEMLKIAISYAKTAKDLYDSLLTINMTDDQVRDYIARLQLTTEQYELINQYDSKYGIRKAFDRDILLLDKVDISTKKLNTINVIFDYYKKGIGQEHIAGTAWGAYNAITGYYSNVKNHEGEKRMSNLVFGSDRLAMSKAINLTLQYEAA